MHLTRYTDYSLRVLIYVGMKQGTRVSIAEISDAFGISRNHLVKVVQHLARMGWVRTIRGRRGGVQLAGDPDEINLGEVVRETEPGFRVVECFDVERNTCPITPVCALRHAVRHALSSFLDTLGGYTLSDVLGNRQELESFLAPVTPKG